MARSERLILDDDDPPAKSAGVDAARASLDLALASVVIGATLLIVGAISILICVVFYNRGEKHGLSQLDLYLALIGGAACVFGALTASIFGIVYGVRGRRLARREQQPGALARAGVFLCTGGIIIWLIVGIDFFLIMTYFINRASYYYY
jgi:hypothetical protein